MENRRRRPQNESSPVPSHCPPGWTWLLAGVLIGMFISFLFYLREVTPPQPCIENSLPTPLTGGKSPFIPEIPAQKSSEGGGIPTHDSSSAPTQKFEFFDKLPSMEVKVPEASSPLTDDLPVTVPGKYVLQVGSFRDKQQAEGLVSHLTTQFGIGAQVKQVVDENEEWYRVQVGPFTNLDELNQTRSTLSTNGIPTILLKF